MKTIWKNIASRVWLIVTPIVLAILIVVNVLASVTFFDAIATLWGRERTRIVGKEITRFETDQGINNKADALANGNRVSKEICEEGFVLLKNNGGALPLASGTKISVFGKNSVNIAVGGSGSGGGITGDFELPLYYSLEQSGFTYNQTLLDFYLDNGRSGKGRSGNPTDLDSGDAVTLDIGETPMASYDESLWSSCADSDAALIVLTRIGGEGFDMPRNEDGTHSLQLTADENALIEKVTSMSFKKVILILNAVTTMELKDVNENDGVDSILWIGYTGGQGILALGEVLKGETLEGEQISPSGKTVDTWAADFTHSPVWENFGAALGGDNYKLQVGRGTSEEKVYFVDYEEGIYVGYRYYETRYASYGGPITSIGESASLSTADEWYASEVVYPFGYGLSYTTFKWKLLNADEVNGFQWDDGGSLTFEVEVKNTGNYAGKDVVELYVTAPYKEGGIEKAAKVLVGFAKTEEILPGSSAKVKITVKSPYDFASYDCYDSNANGFAGYEAEAGTYTFTIGTDAHKVLSEEFIIETSLNEDIQYQQDPVTGAEVTNLYTGVEDASDAQLYGDDGKLHVLSRADWENTWPARRTTSEKILTTEWRDQIKSTASVTNRPEQEYKMPAMGENNGITLEDLVGIDFKSQEVIQDTGSVLNGMTGEEAWNKFLDQLTLQELTALVNQGAFHTLYIQRLQIPQTTSSDGPVGFINFIGAPEIYDTCAYPSEVVIASTWNVELVKEMGRAVGNEALIGNEKGDGAPYSGWYAPGLNIHRSPFGGRNYEYFSEDSFLSGKLTAAIVEGCADKGVYVTMKHFALNDQETHRAINGLLTWATEQSMREIYLKGFEIAVKDVNEYAQEQGRIIPLAVMSSFNRIGERWTGGDYRLLTTILREEWGFQGLVLTDFNTCSHMNVKDMVYAGGDLNLEMAGLRTYTPDKSSAADVTAFREAARNILFVVANSNAMRGSFVMVPPVWQILLFVADGVIVAGLAAWGAAVIVRAFKKKKAAEAAEAAAETSQAQAD